MKVVGVDVGTMNLVSAQKTSENNITINTMRNMFLSIDPEHLAITEIADTQLEYAESLNDSGEVEKIFILGEDAYRFANIFGSEVCRPMSKGVISSKEIDAIDVLTLMMDKLVGKSRGGYCVYSVPAQAIDLDVPPVLYHERVFDRVFSTLGYKTKSLNEAQSIIYSECKDTNFSGISISFGAGLTNVACAYKGTPTLTFSISRGGDWIDNEVSSSLGILPTRVTSIKEKLLNFDTLGQDVKKKEKRIIEALDFYYNSLVEYTLKHFVNQFEKSSEGLEIDEEIPIVVSGGTSLPKGFVNMFQRVFDKYTDFPYDISIIKSARDPLTAVSEGCLIYGLWNVRKTTENKKEE